MASSSDSDLKLADLIQKRTADADQDSQDSGMPFWLQTHTPDVATRLDDTDDESPVEPKPGSKAPSAIADAGAAPSTANASQPAATTDAQHTAAAGGQQKASAAIAGKQQLPLLLPERLVRHKVLIELEPAPHQATELSGDAGAVGRLTANSCAAERGEFKLDLKGVLYHAVVQPLAGTALVVNIGQTEAKVESVMNDFVRLTEEQSYVGVTTLEGTYGLEELMADDEDNYQAVATGNDDAKDKLTAKKAAVKRSKATSGSKAGTASKALKAVKAGVKKKPAAKKAGTSKAAASKSKGTAKKTAKGSAAKTPKSSVSKAPAAGKARNVKKKKQPDSEDESDEWGSDYSD